MLHEHVEVVAPESSDRQTGRGWYMRSSRSIPAGELVLLEEPMCFVLNDDAAASPDICHWCLAVGDSEQREFCSDCRSAWYCGEDCRVKAEPVHSRECMGLRGLRGCWEGSRDARLLLRVLTQQSVQTQSALPSPPSDASLASLVYHEPSAAQKMLVPRPANPAFYLL